MALMLGHNLAHKGLLQISDTAAAFHPWWDKLQDFVVYANIVIGLFALPTTNSLMECALKYPNNTTEKLAPNAFNNGYCSREEMPLFLSFFPYAIILGPLALIIIEKFFTRSVGGLKANQFYNLIVKATSKTEDLCDWKAQNAPAIKEFQAEFRNSNSFVISYVLKNVLEFLVALAFGLWLFFLSRGSILDTSFKIINYKDCKLATTEFVCIVPNTHFYLYILIIGLCMAFVYVLANLYTLLWLVFKRLRKLSSLVHTYRTELKKATTIKWTDLEAVEDVYGGLKSPDVEVLLDLLSETMGVEVALKIMALTDAEFGTMWRIYMHKGGESVTSTSIEASFDPPMITKLLGRKYVKRLMYVVTLVDHHGTKKVEAFEPQIEENKNGIENVVYAVHHGKDKKYPYLAKFDDLNPGELYSLEFSVHFDGKEVSENPYQGILTCPAPPEKLRSSWSLAVDNNDIMYSFTAQWDSQSDLTYIANIIDSNEEVITIETTKCIVTQKSVSGKNLDQLKVWSVDSKGQKSDDFKLQAINPAPKLMRNYVKYLKEKVSKDKDFEKDMNEYMFKVTLLEKTAKELKKVQEGLQMAVALTNIDHKYEGRIKVDETTVEDELEATSKSLELANLFV